MQDLLLPGIQSTPSLIKCITSMPVLRCLNLNMATEVTSDDVAQLSACPALQARGAACHVRRPVRGAHGGAHAQVVNLIDVAGLEMSALQQLVESSPSLTHIAVDADADVVDAIVRSRPSLRV